MNEWVTQKPEFREDCLVIAATEIKAKWYYSIFKIEKCNSDEGWYFGLLTGDGDEWGDIEDLSADKYFVMPLLKTNQ